MQELGIRPMSTWFDKRMMEMWHRIFNMDDNRIVKQVIFGPNANAVRHPGRRKATWLDKVRGVFQEWEIVEAAAQHLSYYQFKKLLTKQLPKVVEKRLAAEEASSSVLRTYNMYFKEDELQFKKPQPFLCGGPCTRGKELIIQLRTQALPLASLTGKFGRARRDNPDDPNHVVCPICSSGTESIAHFLLECDAYDTLRQELFDNLINTVPDKWAHLNTLPSDERAFRMLSDESWGGGHMDIVGSLIAPFVYKCWQHRINALHPPASDPQSAARRVVDGSDAMA